MILSAAIFSLFAFSCFYELLLLVFFVLLVEISFCLNKLIYSESVQIIHVIDHTMISLKNDKNEMKKKNTENQQNSTFNWNLDGFDIGNIHFEDSIQENIATQCTM